MVTRGITATRAIRDAVLSGEFPGGARLNEVELARVLGVSRTPIRAALPVLAAEGLISYTPNSGYVVRSFSWQEVAAIYDVRSTLEGLAARLAAERGLSDLHRGQLHKVVQDGANLVAEGAWNDDICERWQAINNAFHIALQQAAGNAHLDVVLQKSRDIPMLARLRFRKHDLPVTVRSQEDHAAIFDAISAGQVMRAESLAREHAFKSGERMVQYLRSAEMSGRPAASRKTLSAA